MKRKDPIKGIKRENTDDVHRLYFSSGPSNYAATDV